MSSIVCPKCQEKNNPSFNQCWKCEHWFISNPSEVSLRDAYIVAYSRADTFTVFDGQGKPQYTALRRRFLMKVDLFNYDDPKELVLSIRKRFWKESFLIYDPNRLIGIIEGKGFFSLKFEILQSNVLVAKIKWKNLIFKNGWQIYRNEEVLGRYEPIPSELKDLLKLSEKADQLVDKKLLLAVAFVIGVSEPYAYVSSNGH